MSERAFQHVVRTLREAGATGEVHRFAEPVPTAVAAAQALGCPVGAIANSLVFAVSENPLLILASGGHRVDLRAVARRLDTGKIRRADPAFVLAHTGQEVGGVAPIGHPVPLRTVVDTALAEHEVIWAGAGDEHGMFPTSYAELLRLTGGEPLDVA